MIQLINSAYIDDSFLYYIYKICFNNLFFLKDKYFKQCEGLAEFLKEQRSNCAVSHIWGNSEYSQTNYFSYKVNIWGQCTYNIMHS